MPAACYALRGGYRDEKKGQQIPIEMIHDLSFLSAVSIVTVDLPEVSSSDYKHEYRYRAT
jgi:hypothetical protein